MKNPLSTYAPLVLATTLLFARTQFGKPSRVRAATADVSAFK